MNITALLCSEFSLAQWQVEATVALIDAGNTIPFIARYRKEATGSLDDQTLRQLGERLDYLRGLDKRRGEIEASLLQQQVLTDDLAARLAAATTLAALEDLYRPYKPKRRTRATIARERGLEPLACAIMTQQPSLRVNALAAPYVSAEKDVPDVEAALAGARDIIAETISDDAALRSRLRDVYTRDAQLVSRQAGDSDSVYAPYYAYQENVRGMPGHRILAVDRGEKEGHLTVKVAVDDTVCAATVVRAYVRGTGECAHQVEQASVDAWERLIEPSMERESRATLTERAQKAAISVFADNLSHLLMQPPLRGHAALGVDPGFRTGCKLAVVDACGKVLETGVGYFTLPGQTVKQEQARALIVGMIKRHGVTAVAIGNGTASREAEAFVAALLPEGVKYMMVSEAGASVYSASKLAAEEFPEYDVSLRSAVSIARRMQDPLAELVKIDPKAIGVGQYQHDLKPAELEKALDGVVERCVNAVGVEVSTASASLLEHVAGIGPALAQNIVKYRETEGIPNRAALKKVSKLGPRAFEQCAGFLRVRDSAEPLDRTAVHPESYTAAKAMLKKLGIRPADIGIGASGIQATAAAYGMEKLAEELQIGLPTLADILREIQSPGRDPRDDLPPPILRGDVLDMKDLLPGMALEGTVRNVVDFGAFVDIGVHQDGLVHISRLSDRFVRHPSDVVKIGDVVRVWVEEVDVKRGRISLTMRTPSSNATDREKVSK